MAEKVRIHNLKLDELHNALLNFQQSLQMCKEEVILTEYDAITAKLSYILNQIHNFAEEKDAVVWGAPPPPIIFERLKLPQQIIHRRKWNLSESPNHQKYWENILISRFYEQFSRNSRILGHFWKFEKISNS